MNTQLEVIRKLIESNDLSRINLAAVMLENIEHKEDFKIKVTADNYLLVTSNDYLFDYINFSELNEHYIAVMLVNSPIAEKIWDSGRLDLTKLNGNNISYILNFSPITEKIWDSNKLDLTRLDGYSFRYIFTNSPIAEKIWDSDKLDLTKLDRSCIIYIITNSSIAEKIWNSGKLELSLLDKLDYGYFFNKFGTNPSNR